MPYLLLEEARDIKGSTALGHQPFVSDDGFNEGCWCHVKAGVPSLQRRGRDLKRNPGEQDLGEENLGEEGVKEDEGGEAEEEGLALIKETAADLVGCRKVVMI